MFNIISEYEGNYTFNGTYEELSDAFVLSSEEVEELKLYGEITFDDLRIEVI